MISKCCKVTTNEEKNWLHGIVVVCSFCYQPCEVIDGGEHHGNERTDSGSGKMGTDVG